MVPGRSDEELRCLRQSCSVLAKALSLDIKAALRLAASTAQVSAARGVLRHAQRPLSALNTFSAMLLPRLGARVVLCGPPELLPESARGLGEGIDGGGNIEIERDFDRALARADVVMMLRIQKERLAGFDLDLAEFIVRYQLSEERLAAASPKLLVMHPGPIIRGLEITGEVADGPQSAIEEQVSQGLAIRRAVLARALGVTA